MEGYMTEIKIENKVICVTSFHVVYKPEKISTPLRIVFNACSNKSSGYSLNSILLNGATIQQDLFFIINRFGIHNYSTFCVDIKKM